MAGVRQQPPRGRCVKPMWTSYGERARSGGLSEVRDLTAVLARLERWTLPLAIVILFAYPNPLVPVALALLVASGGVRLLRRGIWARATPVEPWIALLAVGTLGGLAVSHNYDAALLRLTGLVGALAVFYAVRGYITSEREVRLVGLSIVFTTALGIFAVLALLRGSLPESPVTTVLSPLLTPFAGVSRRDGRYAGGERPIHRPPVRAGSPLAGGRRVRGCGAGARPHAASPGRRRACAFGAGAAAARDPGARGVPGAGPRRDSGGGVPDAPRLVDPAARGRAPLPAAGARDDLARRRG